MGGPVHEPQMADQVADQQITHVRISTCVVFHGEFCHRSVTYDWPLRLNAAAAESQAGTSHSQQRLAWKSITTHFLHLCSRQRKLSLNLATVEAISEVDVIPTANPQIAGHITVFMAACKIHAAHVRTMGKNASEAKA